MSEALRLRAAAWCWPALLLAAALHLPAAATPWNATTLSGVATGTLQADLAASDGSGALLHVEQLDVGTGTLQGSDLGGYEGLWLGAPGESGRYAFSVGAAATAVSFHFTALTFDGSDAEALTGFATNGPATLALRNAESATLAGGSVTALDLDSRGTLTFTGGAAGFTRWSFTHLQPAPLNGFVIDRIDVTFASAVPELPAAMLLPAGLLLLARRRWRGVAAAGLAGLMAACGGGKGGGSGDSTADALAAPQAAAAASAPVSQRDAVRLAEQASFGPSEALVAQIRSTGTEAWLAAQIAATGSRYTRGNGDEVHKPDGTDFCSGKGDSCFRDWYSTQPLLWDFYRNATTQPDQLRQRMAYTLGQILVISNFEVSGTYGFRYFHNMLLDNALGNYREVLRRLTRSPLMGDYLDHVNNSRDAPNENYARELLQLFSVGTCRLNLDGTLEGGRCQPTYDNTTVRNYAFALTGWTYPAGGSSVYGCYPEGANCTYYQGDMVERPALADDQPRALLGGVQVPATRTPAQALDAVLDSLMNHPNMAPFIARQLIQHLVKSNPTPAYVRRVATAFNAGRYQGRTQAFGQGTRGDLAATVAAVLLDTEARNSAPPLVAEKLREPVLLFTGVLRALGGRTDGDAFAWWWGEELRQHLFRSPSVFGHFPPNYPVAGTGLVGPAFGIYNVNTALARLNFLNQMIYWDGAGADSTIPGAVGTSVDLGAFVADADDPARLVDRFVNLATGGRMTATSRDAIVKAVAAWTPAETDQWRLERARTAAYLVFASPAYQVLQ